MWSNQMQGHLKYLIFETLILMVLGVLDLYGITLNTILEVVVYYIDPLAELNSLNNDV